MAAVVAAAGVGPHPCREMVPGCSTARNGDDGCDVMVGCGGPMMGGGSRSGDCDDGGGAAHRKRRRRRHNV